MLYNDQNSNSRESNERVLPYQKLRGLVEKILKRRVKKPSDVEDISQDVFRRSWQWATKHNKNLSTDQWKKLIAKITFNEINRFYTKKRDLLTNDVLDSEIEPINPDNSIINPQFIIEIAEELHKLSFRQRLSLILSGGEILPYLKVVLPTRDIAKLLEIDADTLLLLESEIPLTEDRITEVIEEITKKECKSSIRDERCKGRKLLKRRLFKT